MTHSVNFSSFPQSLKIVCIFDTNQDRTNFLSGEGQQSVSGAIQQAFNQVGIQLKSIDKHISYDTQENCDRDHQGSGTRGFSALASLESLNCVVIKGREMNKAQISLNKNTLLGVFEQF